MKYHHLRESSNTSNCSSECSVQFPNTCSTLVELSFRFPAIDRVAVSFSYCSKGGQSQPGSGTEKCVHEESNAQLEQPCSMEIEKHFLMAENQRLKMLLSLHINGWSTASRDSMQSASHVPGLKQRYLLGLQQLHKLYLERTEKEEEVARMVQPEQVSRNKGILSFSDQEDR